MADTPQFARDLLASKQRRVDRLEDALRSILDADHRGPAAALREALARAAALIGWQPAGPPRQHCVEDWETGPHGVGTPPRADCQDERPRGGIVHGPGSPIADLVREEPRRRLVPRPWQRPVDPTIEAGDPA